jgi:hypothetical protein
MNKEKFEELKNKVTDFVNEKPTESAIIGASVVLILGYCVYKLFSRSKATKDKTLNPEDVIVDDGTTLGNPDEAKEETKAQNKKFLPVADSDDEPMLLRQSVKPKRDPAGVLDRETLTKIFDKRSTIRGMRKLDRQFKEKRRAMFDDSMEYK